MNGIEQSLLDDFDLVGDYSPGAGRRLKRISYTRDRLWLFGLGTQRMHPEDETGPAVWDLTFTRKCAVMFRPRRVVLQAMPVGFTFNTWGDPLGFMWVNDVKIASRSQFANAAPVGFPAASFKGVADDMLVKFDTCAAGREIEISISYSPEEYPDWPFETFVTAGMFGYSAARK